jgi:hypothetical protein
MLQLSFETFQLLHEFRILTSQKLHKLAFEGALKAITAFFRTISRRFDFAL